MKFKILSLGLVILGLFSCTSSEKNVKVEKALQISLKRVISLPLDSVTAISNNYYQILQNDSLLHVYFFNSLNHSVYCYDLLKESFLSLNQFEKEGPNGLGSRITSFKILKDSMIVFHSYYRRELIFTRPNGMVDKRIKLDREDFQFAPVTSQNQPFVLNDERLIMYSGRTSNREDLENTYMILTYSLVDSSARDTGIRLGKNYETSTDEYFPGDLSMPSIGVNESEELSIVSFPLDDSIKLINKDGQVKSKYFGFSEHQVNSPLSKGAGPKPPYEQLKDLLRFSRYGSIHYDPFRRIYLRTFIAETPEELLDQNKLKVEQKIVFGNDEFEVLGVSEFKGTDQLLFTKEGMYQFVYNPREEDSLKINVFSYEF